MPKRTTSGGRITAGLRALVRRPVPRSAPGAASDLTHPAGAESAATFDESVLDQLVALDGTGEALAELVGLYARDAGARRAALTSAAQQGDAPAVRQAAHAIKGSAMNFGARRLAELAAEVEDLAQAGSIADERLVATTCHELDAAVRFLVVRTNDRSPDRSSQPRGRRD